MEASRRGSQQVGQLVGGGSEEVGAASRWEAASRRGSWQVGEARSWGQLVVAVGSRWGLLAGWRS